MAVEDERLLPVELLRRLAQLRELHVTGTGDPARLVLVGLAHVDELDLATLVQGGHLGGRHLLLEVCQWSHAFSLHMGRRRFARRPAPNYIAPVSDRRRATSGSPYEQRYGFCRALRAGDRIVVAGTVALWPDGSHDPDPFVQTTRCLEIIEAAIRELGGTLADVVRTRMMIVDRGDQDAVGRAHAAAFGTAPPASTMVVVAGLLDERWKVEIEAEAQLDA